MFSEGQVQVMISVPAMRNKTAYCQTVLDELRRLIDISQASTPAVSEEWSIWPLVNPESCMRVYSYASPSLDGWLQDKPSMCNDCARTPPQHAPFPGDAQEPGRLSRRHSGSMLYLGSHLCCN